LLVRELEPYPTSADLNPVVKRLEYIQAHGGSAASSHLPHFFLAAEGDFSGRGSLEILFEELAQPPVPKHERHVHAMPLPLPPAFGAKLLLAEREDPTVIQSWLTGLNPELGDRVPLRLMRENDLEKVTPEIMGAARAFLVGG
jgi:hypothetical protein